MKRLSIFLLAAALLFVAGNGFVPNHKAPFSITGCNLKVDDMNLIIKPGDYNLNSPIHFKVRLMQKKHQVAFGVAKLELLKMPSETFSIRVPLSSQLRSKSGYDVLIEAYADVDGSVKQNFSNVQADGVSSNNFFNKEFVPIPELRELRNSIGAISVKREMGIN